MSRALVLSGGGAVGIAWEIGLAAGLARHRVDLRDADFVTGTSAGSAVGARIALGRDFEPQVELYHKAAQAPAGAERARRGSPSAEKMAQIMGKVAETLGGEGTPEERRAELGRFALASQALPEEAFVAAFADLRGEAWPSHYYCPTVDAVSGEWVVWDVASGVDLDRGVASSCCVPGLFAPITINGRRYIDGGFRSATSADLAKGHDRVLVISLLGGAAQTGALNNAMPFAAALAGEVKFLRDHGSEVLLLEANAASAAAMGGNLMDSGAALAALEAGLAQGKADAARVDAFWNRA